MRTSMLFLLSSLSLAACGDKDTGTAPEESDTDTDADADADADTDTDTDTDTDIYFTADEESCGIVYHLPSDVDWTIPTSFDEATQNAFDQFSWQTFLALASNGVGEDVPTTGDTETLWSQWSSTADLLNSGASDSYDALNNKAAPVRYYPAECIDAVGDYSNYRVLEQVGKVEDSFLEANGTGLSNHPVVDRNGNFIRYEVLLSPTNFDYINGLLYSTNNFETLSADVNFPCGEPGYSGGDPAGSKDGSYQMGAITVKAAWMDLSSADASTLARYHTEELLVFDAAEATSDNTATCAKKTMGLVGLHVVRKTPQQPVWVWSTWEHTDNAPFCDDGMPDGTPNTSCPQPDSSTDYAFYSSSCGEVDSSGDPVDGADACAACNAGPAPASACESAKSGSGWCLDGDQGSTVGGLSRICTQVAEEQYPWAERWNGACQDLLGESVWANYRLVGTQWIPVPDGFDPDDGCVTVQQDSTWIQNNQDVAPTVETASSPKPILGNNSMESYERSNCMACHNAKTNQNKTTNRSGDDIWPHQLVPAPEDPSAKDVTWGTHQPDFAWWLSQEVPHAAAPK